MLKDVHSGKVTVLYDPNESISGLKTPAVRDPHVRCSLTPPLRRMFRISCAVNLFFFLFTENATFSTTVSIPPADSVQGVSSSRKPVNCS